MRSTWNQSLWCLTFTWDQQVNHAASGHGTTFFFIETKDCEHWLLQDGPLIDIIKIINIDWYQKPNRLKMTIKRCKSREIRGGENKQKHTIIYWMCNGFRAKEKRHFDLHKHAEEDEVYIGILNIVYSSTKSISI